jgi:hypothetical protein
MRLEVSFPKVTDRSRVATFTWSDGVVAECPVFGAARRLPHDLEHYVVDAKVRAPYGFWTLAGQQAPFESFTLVRGRWSRDRIEWFQRIKRKHHDEMVQSEAMGIIGALARGDLDLVGDWRHIRRHLTRSYAITRDSVYASLDQRDLASLVDFHRDVEARWDAVPVGGAFEVSWPPGG